MYISARERKILEILLSTDHEITFQELAEDLDVSIRTIQRDIKGIEDILRDTGISLEKKPGNGLVAIGLANRKKQLLDAILTATHTDYTTEERHTFLLSRLLQSAEPIKQSALSNELKVSLATIGNDLDKLSDLLKNSNLELVRKRGSGVEIFGSETAKRQMMSSIIHRYTDELELLLLFHNKTDKKSKYLNEIDGRLLGLIDKGILTSVERVVTRFIRKNNNHISDRAYLGLIVHLALAIERFSEGKLIMNTLPKMERLKKSKEYETASALMAELEEAFRIRFPEEEKSYIAMHLIGAKALKEKELQPDEDLSLWLSTQKLVSLTGKRLGIDFTKNDSLYNGLVTHLKPAIYRLEERMGIQNPLLSSIKKEYGELFDIVIETAGEVFPHLQIPEDEIGFLVMHFASTLLMSKEQNPLSALVVCTSGIGTSKVLTATLQKEFPEVKLVRNVSAFDIHSLRLDEYDLILSTVHLNITNRSYLLVNPFLTDRDIGEINAAIQKLTFRKTIQQETYSESEDKGFLQYVQLLAGYTDSIANVLEHFSVTEVTKTNDDKEQLIRFISTSLARHNLVTDDQKIYDDLLLRENIGGTGIPNTGLALLHTRSEAVKFPLFKIFRLKDPVPIAAMDSSLVQMQSALVMLLPAKPKKGAVEVMSHISSMIIEDVASNKLFEYSDKYYIYTFLAKGLKEHLGEIQIH